MDKMTEYTPIKGRNNLPFTAKRLISEAREHGWQLDPSNPIIVAGTSGASTIMKGFDALKMVAENAFEALALPSISSDALITLAISYVRDDEDDEPVVGMA